MHRAPSRRRVLTTLSSATAAGLIGGARGMAQEAPPETTTIRLVKIPGICVAPQYVAEELLRTEGFTDIQYFESPGSNPYPGFAAGKIDISMAFIAPFIIQVDAGVPIVLLGGVHAGCFELFGTERVNSIRDLKGKTVGVNQGSVSGSGFATIKTDASLVPGGANAVVTPLERAQMVAGVFVRSSSWTPAFLGNLQAQDL